MKRVNTCGIPEELWVDGKCSECGCTCDMVPSVIVDAKNFEYAKKNDMLVGGVWMARDIIKALENPVQYRKAPKYLRAAVALDGMQFSSLSEFPAGEVLRCVRDSKDHSFRVGALVWRSQPRPGYPDGINIRQENGCMDAEFCDAALQGACFERTSYRVSEFER